MPTVPINQYISTMRLRVPTRTVKQRTPRKIQIQHAMTRIPSSLAHTIICSNTQHLPNLSLLNERAHLHAQREIPRPHSLHQKEVLLLGQINQDFGLRRIHGKRFLAQHILPTLQRETRVLVVMRMRRGDVDDVDVGVSHELIVRSVRGGLSGDVDAVDELLRARL